MCKYFSQMPSLLNLLTINALQNLLFCFLKAALLYGKSVGFATQNSRFRNAKRSSPFLTELSLQNQTEKLSLFHEESLPNNICEIGRRVNLQVQNYYIFL